MTIFFCQSACQRYGKYIDLNGFLRPQLHAFHWHIQLPLPPPSSLPGKRRSPGFLMGKHSAGIKHENTQISVEWQDFDRRMLGFLTELSLQFFSIKIAAAKWSRGRTQANNESHWRNGRQRSRLVCRFKGRTCSFANSLEVSLGKNWHQGK